MNRTSISVFLYSIESKTRDFFSECGEKLTDILFIIDSSDSVGLENFKKILSFVQSFVLQFSIGPQSVQFSVITFFLGVSPPFSFNTYSTINEVIQAIQDLEYNANSDVYEALQYAHEESFKPANGARANSSKIAIFISDGVFEDRASTAREAALLHDIAEVFAIGIGPEVDYDELKKIASGQGISQVNSFDQLQTIQQQLTDAACPKGIHSNMVTSLIN